MKAALEALDRQRRMLGMTKSYIAKRMSCSTSKISRIFSGEREATHGEIWELMDILQIEAGQMAEYFPRPKKKGRKSA